MRSHQTPSAPRQRLVFSLGGRFPLAFVASAAAFQCAAMTLNGQAVLVDWTALWYYMHPTTGVLPPGSGATEPNAGAVKWYAPEPEFSAHYSGPGFSFSSHPSYEAGWALGPLDYGGMAYALSAGAEFPSTGYGLLYKPNNNDHLTAYFRTTFSVPNDGRRFANPVIRYLFDDGGWVYLDGALPRVHHQQLPNPRHRPQQLHRMIRPTIGEKQHARNTGILPVLASGRPA